MNALLAPVLNAPRRLVAPREGFSEHLRAACKVSGTGEGLGFGRAPSHG